jgi:tRNA threonylcarbamoyladenosine biosynthesis protein TsaB
MKVLAIDTTSERESVALADDLVLLAETRVRADGHSRQVLSAVEFVLRAAGIAAGEIEGYAVTLGPGSFTGVRVGLSTVQGLALASGQRCLGVSTLDVLAAAIAGEAPTLVPMVDAARGGQVFTGLYDGEGRAREDPQSEVAEAVLDRVSGAVAVVGDGADRYAAAIRSRRPDALFPRRDLYLAGVLARLAAPRLAAGEGIAPGALRPLYLRAADIRPGGP